MALMGQDVQFMRELIRQVPGNDMHEKAVKVGVVTGTLVKAYKGFATPRTIGKIKKAIQENRGTALSLAGVSTDSLLMELRDRGYKISMKVELNDNP